MPYLIKKISGEILPNNEAEVKLLKLVKAKIGVEDYIDVDTLIGFTQNFSKVVNVELNPILSNYGLKNNTNFTLFEISY